MRHDFTRISAQRQFVGHRQQKIIPQSTKDLVDKLLLEKIQLAGIARVADVSERSARSADRP